MRLWPKPVIPATACFVPSLEGCITADDQPHSWMTDPWPVVLFPWTEGGVDDAKSAGADVRCPNRRHAMNKKLLRPQQTPWMVGSPQPFSFILILVDNVC